MASLQSSMLEKLSSIIDNKLDSMKRQLEESSNTQMSELKKIRLTEPRTFKKKGQEQQFKHNQQVKSVVSEAKDAVNSGKQDACIAKLNKGIELIDRRQKLILIADKSEYGWKTVGEYLDNELADNDQDAKKMKKAEKEAQRKRAPPRLRRLVPGHSSLREQWETQLFRHYKARSLSHQGITHPLFHSPRVPQEISVHLQSWPETWHVFQLW